MSKILDKLKEAEEQRQRVVAERRRLETEADAALAGQERAEAAARAEHAARRRRQAEARARVEAEKRQAAQGPRQWRWRLAGALLVTLAMAGLLLLREEATHSATRPAAVGSAGKFELKLERNLEKFAAGVKRSEGK